MRRAGTKREIVQAVLIPPEPRRRPTIDDLLQMLQRCHDVSLAGGNVAGMIASIMGMAKLIQGDAERPEPVDADPYSRCQTREEVYDLMARKLQDNGYDARQTGAVVNDLEKLAKIHFGPPSAGRPG